MIKTHYLATPKKEQKNKKNQDKQTSNKRSGWNSEKVRIITKEARIIRDKKTSKKGIKKRHSEHFGARKSQ